MTEVSKWRKDHASIKFWSFGDACGLQALNGGEVKQGSVISVMLNPMSRYWKNFTAAKVILKDQPYNFKVLPAHSCTLHAANNRHWPLSSTINMSFLWNAEYLAHVSRTLQWASRFRICSTCSSLLMQAGWHHETLAHLLLVAFQKKYRLNLWHLRIYCVVEFFVCVSSLCNDDKACRVSWQLLEAASSCAQA